jgi:hypothetical protein
MIIKERSNRTDNKAGREGRPAKEKPVAKEEEQST